MNGTSRVTGDCHARFCEPLGGEIPRGDSAAGREIRPYRDPGGGLVWGGVRLIRGWGGKVTEMKLAEVLFAIGS